MSEYPLSTVSSKKIKKSANSLYERSACQSTAPALLNKAEYCHILKGERVFIEMYYQGRVMSTAYNEWIEFMGGTLYKRLNPKVTLFLTTCEDNELGSIMERVRRTCPTCKIVSILWFQQCFRKKAKVPFDQFQLDLQTMDKYKEKSKQSQEQERIDLTTLEGFLSNIAEDIEIDYKDFFKENKMKFFQYPPKNAIGDTDIFIKAQEFDLGPGPKRKIGKSEKEKVEKVEKGEQKKKRKSSGHKPDNRLTVHNPPQEKLFQKKCEQSSNNEASGQRQFEKNSSIPFPHQDQGLSFNLMMEKYLTKRQDNKQTSNPSTQNRENQKKSLNSMNNNKQTSQYFMSIKSKQSVATEWQPVTVKQKSPLYSFQKRPKYYDKKMEIKPDYNIEQELQQLEQKLQHQKFNHIIVVSDSKNLSAKVESINQRRYHPNQIYLQNINYHVYINLLKHSPPKHTAYFLFNPRRVIDRPLYYALTINNSLPPKLVSCRLADEVDSYNQKLRSGSNLSNSDSTTLNLRYFKELTLQIKSEVIKNKKIVFTQSELPQDLLQIIVLNLGGEWVSQHEYLMGRKANIVATNRNSLRDGACLTICEQELWKKLFPFPEDTQLL